MRMEVSPDPSSAVEFSYTFGPFSNCAGTIAIVQPIDWQQKTGSIGKNGTFHACYSSREVKHGHVARRGRSRRKIGELE
jgi:hypothetical protein